MTPEQVRATKTIRKILCRRELYVDRTIGGMTCDGDTLVCGRCDTTAHMIREALEGGK